MSQILFIYDALYSAKKKAFTVQISERECINNRWLQKGPKKIYYLNDIKNLRNNIPDLSLLQDAIQSELTFRRNEGRFFKESDELTRLRINADILPNFLRRSTSKNILLAPRGEVINMEHDITIKPVLKINKKNEILIPQIFIGKLQLYEFDYLVPSNPPIAVKGSSFYILHQRVSLKFLESIPCRKECSKKIIDDLMSRAHNFKESIQIESQAIPQAKILKNESFYPILNIEQNFHYAELLFEYPENIIIKSNFKNRVYTDINKNIEVHRNLSEEKKFINLLTDCGAKYQPFEKLPFYLPSGNVEKILHKIDKEAIEILIAGKPLHLNPKISWKIEAIKKEIKIHLTIETDRQKANFPDIMRALNQGKSYLTLANGDLTFISNNNMADLKTLINSGTISTDCISFKDSDFHVINKTLSQKKNLITNDHFEALLSFEKEQTVRCDIPLASNFESVLRLYQKQGYTWLINLFNFNFNGILSDDMGLGKTLQVISLLSTLKNSCHLSPSLIIVPKTLIYNWEIEIKKFSKNLTYQLHSGSDRIKDVSYFSQSDLTITTYGIIRTDQELLCKFEWNYIILDESQAIKNPEAKTSIAVKTLPAKHKLCITGTPVENTPLDLWSQFDFLMPGFLGEIKDFRTKYLSLSGEELKQLNIKTKPFILRRNKKQVLNELPPKTEITLYADMTESQNLAYVSAYEKAKASVSKLGTSKTSGKTMQILEIILRLRQIALHPSLALQKIDEVEWTSGKDELIIETAKEILSENHKILIFSSFTQYLKLLRSSFNTLNLKSYYLDGKVKDRTKVVKEFQEDTDSCVFFISLKVGGLGLNLTEANYVFLLDPWWNPAVENQAIDRCYRMGQDKHVTAYRFISKDTIEEKVQLLKKAKQTMTDHIVSESELNSIPLSEDILKELLE